MSIKLPVIALALCLAACSQGGQSQSQADKAPAPAQPASTASGGSTPASKPESAPSASAAVAATAEKPTQPAAPSASEKSTAAEPQFREVTIPSGTALSVRLTTPVASDTSKIEDEVRGSLTKPVIADGVTAVPAGTEVVGTVRDAKRSGRVKGLATVAFRFERLMMRDEPLAIRTVMVSRHAAANRRDDVKKGAIGAGAGALIGGIVGGGKGAAIGAGVGGTGAVVATRGDEVRLESGTIVRTTLQQPVKVVIPRQSAALK